MAQPEQQYQPRTITEYNKPTSEKPGSSPGYRAAVGVAIGLLALSINHVTDTIALPFTATAAENSPVRKQPNEFLMNAVLGQMVEENGGIACPDIALGDTQVIIGSGENTHILCLDFRKTALSTDNVSLDSAEEPKSTFIVPLAAVRESELLSAVPNPVNIVGTYENPEVSQEDCIALTNAARKNFSRLLQTADPAYYYLFRIVLDLGLSSKCDESTPMPNQL